MEDLDSTLLDVDIHAKIKSYNSPNSFVSPSLGGPPVQNDDPISPLLEGVCPGAPPGQEGGQSNGLEGLGNDGDTDSVEGALLLEHLGNELQLALLAQSSVVHTWAVLLAPERENSRSGQRWPGR